MRILKNAKLLWFAVGPRSAVRFVVRNAMRSLDRFCRSWQDALAAGVGE